VIKLDGARRQTNSPTDDEIIALQQKIFVLDMIYWIVELENTDLNPRIKEVLIVSNFEYRK
jgi:hypothetical protein